MEDSRLNAVKQPIPFVKGRLNLAARLQQPLKFPLRNLFQMTGGRIYNHITVDKIYYLSSLFVSFFFTNFSFQIYFSTAENRKTEFCGNALKLYSRTKQTKRHDRASGSSANDLNRFLLDLSHLVRALLKAKLIDFNFNDFAWLFSFYV